MAKRILVSTAPARLIAEYRRSEKILGRDLLGDLLHDARMLRAWKSLVKKAPSDHKIMRVWAHIRHAKHRSNRFKPPKYVHKARSEERDKFLKLARRADSLGKLLAKIPSISHMPAYQLFPDDDLAALGIGELRALPPLEQVDLAHRVLRWWPVAPDLLAELAARCREIAERAMTDARPDSRSVGDAAARAFVLALATSFKQEFGQPLYEVVARTTEVALRFERDREMSKAAVQQIVNKSGA